MRILAFGSEGRRDELRNAVAEGRRADYVYMYPPRQAYRPIDASAYERLSPTSLSKFDDCELYIHFPFCRQICAFCNLFATTITSPAEHRRYVSAVLKELEAKTTRCRKKVVNSIYFGGGTPSLLDIREWERVFEGIERTLPGALLRAGEVSMEVAPDTVERDKFVALVGLGLTRVNLGVQSLNDREVGDIGRRHGEATIYRAISILKEVGLKNLSIDLINGLPGQSSDEWTHSLRGVIALKPDTICIYPFTQRAFTGFGSRPSSSADPARYRRWDEAVSVLADAGFERETHVRFVRTGSGGGYLQKANHWALKNVIGVGAGARSYLWELDCRNGYSVKRRRTVVDQYVGDIESDISPVRDGFILNDDERRRKAVILNVIELRRAWYRSMFDSDPLIDFPEEFSFLLKAGMAQADSEVVRLSPLGLRHRDTVVQLFFSPTVMRLVAEYDYDQ